MNKFNWASPEDIVVFPPRPETLVKYLQESPLWTAYARERYGKTVTVWVFCCESDTGEEIFILNDSLFRRDKNVAIAFESICEFEAAFNHTTVDQTEAFKLALAIKGWGSLPGDKQLVNSQQGRFE